MQGLHITADCHQCACDIALLTDATLLGTLCTQAVADAGLQAVAQLFHTFPATAHGPGGVTATVLLAESHLCVHTWPEQRAVTLDVYVCNFGGDHSAKAEALMTALQALLSPGRAEVQRVGRGKQIENAAIAADFWCAATTWQSSMKRVEPLNTAAQIAVAALVALGLLGGCLIVAYSGFATSPKRGGPSTFVPAPEAYFLALTMYGMSILGLLAFLRNRQASWRTCAVAAILYAFSAAALISMLEPT